MTIRKATVDDVRDISRIYALSWKAAYVGMVPQDFLDAIDDDRWVDKFSKDIGDGTLSALMICDSEAPVGCAAFGRSRDEKLPDWGEIVSVYLRPEYFGKGYGQALLGETVATLRGQGFERVYLWVLRENSRARRFYEKHGFEYSGDECTLEIMGEKLVDLRYVSFRRSDSD
jgi:RimJ/RimL family protein N-acetyltransferase